METEKKKLYGFGVNDTILFEETFETVDELIEFAQTEYDNENSDYFDDEDQHCILISAVKRVAPSDFAPSLDDIAEQMTDRFYSEYNIDGDAESSYHPKKEAKKEWKAFVEKYFDIPYTLIGYANLGWYDLKEHCWVEEKVDNANKVEPKFKVKYAGNEYNVFETKDIAGVTFYGIEDEPNHIDYVKAENCEIISVYAIKENGSPYPTKPAVFSEKKPKRMISAEAKECIYGSDNEQVSSAKNCKNDTLLNLLNKMPSCITVDGIDYHFVLKKTIAYMAFYEGEGEGSGKVIFWMAGDLVDILNEILRKLKEGGLLE